MAASLVRGGSGAVTAVGKMLRNVVPRDERPPALGIERVAAMRQARSDKANRVIEGTLATVAAPAMLATGGVSQLLASMERHQLAATVLIGAPPIASNAWLLTEAARCSPRLIPVTTMPELDPAANANAWQAAFEKLAAEGAQGFKIHLNMDGLSPQHHAYRSLFKVASDRDCFVIVHTGCFHVPSYHRHGPIEPGELEPLLREFPDVRVCLAHMNRERPEAAWEVMERHSQVFTDTSWQPASVIRQAVDRVGIDRVLLGSDWPLLHADLQGDALQVLRKAVSAEEVEQIGHGNAKRFLGRALVSE